MRWLERAVARSLHPRRRALSSRRAGRLLIQSENVSAGVAEARCDLGRIDADRLNDLAPMSGDGIDGHANVVDHDVDDETGIAGRWATLDPGAAHGARAIVERQVAVTACSHLPAEHRLVERGRALNVGGWNLDVAHLPVGARWRHWCSCDVERPE